MGIRVLRTSLCLLVLAVPSLGLLACGDEELQATCVGNACDGASGFRPAGGSTSSGTVTPDATAPDADTPTDGGSDADVVVTTCGNGIVEAGEGCDGFGETEDCNLDCTVASCGDGVVNARRGETCDTDQAFCVACDSRVSFSYTGAAESITAPAGVGHVIIQAWGGQGGGGTCGTDGMDYDGGAGGYAVATFPIAAGAVLEIRVGGQGQFNVEGTAGGFNGGGAGGRYGGGGGGASDARLGGQGLEHRVLIAGGGGGGQCGDATNHGAGGAGGGPAGETGLAFTGRSGGGGGTAAAGGASFADVGEPIPAAGSLGQGAGSSDDLVAGGGGGLYGGGSAFAAGGGGGSGTTTTGADAEQTVGGQFGHGYVEITWLP